MVPTEISSPHSYATCMHIKGLSCTVWSQYPTRQTTDRAIGMRLQMTLYKAVMLTRTGSQGQWLEISPQKSLRTRTRININNASVLVWWTWCSFQMLLGVLVHPLRQPNHRSISQCKLLNNTRSLQPSLSSSLCAEKNRVPASAECNNGKFSAASGAIG